MSGVFDEDGNFKPGCGVAMGAAMVIAFIVICAMILAWPFAKTPADKIGLSYGGGVVEGAHFQGVHEPGSGTFFNGWGDRLYKYPVTQRNYIISARADEGDIQGADIVEAPSRDGVRVGFQVATYFELNQPKIQAFHEKIGLKYHAWTDDGWTQMLNDSFRQQIENSIQGLSRQFLAVEVYSDQNVLLAMQDAIGKSLKSRIEKSLGGEYFCGVGTGASKTECSDFKFVIKKVTVPDTVAVSLERNRTSEIEVQTKKNEIEQNKAEAQSIRELNAALNEAGDQYTLLQAIKSGQVKFWVLPGGTNLTVPAP